MVGSIQINECEIHKCITFKGMRLGDGLEWLTGDSNSQGPAKDNT